VVDLLLQSFNKKILTKEEFSNIKEKVTKRWENLSRDDAQKLLCPLILAGMTIGCLDT